MIVFTNCVAADTPAAASLKKFFPVPATVNDVSREPVALAANPTKLSIIYLPPILFYVNSELFASQVISSAVALIVGV
jgi:hypothetical protein